MCSSTTPTPTTFSLLLTHTPSLSPRRHCNFPFISPITFLSHYSLTNTTPNFRFSSTIADVNKPSNFSWVLSDDDDDFGGWAFSETPIPQKKKGFPTFWVAGIGTSIALLVAALTYFKLSKDGFRLPIRSSTPVTSVEVVDNEVEKTKLTDTDAPAEESEVSEKPEFDSYDEVTRVMSSEYPRPRIVNIIVDSNQKEAMHTLQKLKILDEDVQANELCTRREYARWLVRASSLLERNPRYKVTTAALSGSVMTAYEDVTIGDPDFDFIQALAEAGVTPSNLSSKHKSDGGLNFHPESYLSRRDLIEWRSQLEYDFTTTGNQEILKRKLDLMDVRETSFNESPGLFMDMLAGDRSLLRRVFGQIKRLQPKKPTTVAQASVALTSGRMIEAIQSELLRMQGEEASRKAAKEEIKQELLDRGEIKKFWDEKMEEEKNRGVKVQQFYEDVCNLLEEEKIVQEGALNGLLKEKAAMDCQKQLLEGLKEDVNEMSERLVSERNELIFEEETAQTLRSDLLNRKEGILDAKSLLEAEIEALRILRSWIEDEARKSEARSKVLEEVGRRWKWDSQ